MQFEIRVLTLYRSWLGMPAALHLGILRSVGYSSPCEGKEGWEEVICSLGSWIRVPFLLREWGSSWGPSWPQANTQSHSWTILLLITENVPMTDYPFYFFPGKKTVLELSRTLLPLLNFSKAHILRVIITQIRNSIWERKKKSLGVFNIYTSPSYILSSSKISLWFIYFYRSEIYIT